MRWRRSEWFALIIMLGLAVGGCGQAAPLASGPQLTSASADQVTPAPATIAIPTPIPLPASAALPSAEDAIARAKQVLRGAGGQPVQIVGVTLLTLRDVVGQLGVDPSRGAAPTTPIWRLDADFPGAATPSHGAGCPPSALTIFLDALTGNDLGYRGTPPAVVITPVAGSTLRPSPVTILSGARLPTIEAALALAHQRVGGPGGKPARVVAAARLPLRETWARGGRPDLDPNTPVWQVALDEAQAGFSCPPEAAWRTGCTGTHVALLLNAVTGQELSVAIGP